MTEHSERWTDSTSSQVTYFGGPSHQNSLMPLAQPRFDERATGAELIPRPFGPELKLTVEGTRASFSYTAHHDDEYLRKRMVGCVLLALMPSQGIDEALPALRDMYEYWTTEPSHVALPSPTRDPVRAGAIDVRSRPDLVISDQ